VYSRQLRKAIDATVTHVRELSKDKQGLQKRCHDLAEELARNNQKFDEIDEIIIKKQELISYMENRIASLQDENIKLVHPDKYNTATKDIDKLKLQIQQVTAERDQYKKEIDTQISIISKCKAELRHVHDELVARDNKQEALEKELIEKNLELTKLGKTVKKLTEDNVDLGQEKKRYQILANDLQRKSLEAEIHMPHSADEMASVDEDNESKVPSDSEDYDQDKVFDLGSEKADIQKMMKALSENNLHANNDLFVLDREIALARSKLAELQQTMMNSDVDDDEAPVNSFKTK